MAESTLTPDAADGRSGEKGHDAWFRGEVEQALREADDPAVVKIDDADMKAEWERRRAELPLSGAS